MMNFDDLSQSATDAIGSLWQPPQPRGVQYAAPAGPTPNTMAGPQAADLSATAPLRRGHGLMDRITQHLTGDPGGFDQVLSAQEREDARPSLFGALFGGDKGQTPSEIYAARLDSLVKRHENERAIVQQRNMLANRAAILKANPAPGFGATEEQIAAWANRVMALSLGDKDVESTLGPLVDRFASNKSTRDANAGKPQMAQLGSAVTTFDPLHKNADGSIGAFLDPTTHQWVTSLDRGLTADQKKENAIRDAEAALRLQVGQQQFDEGTGQRQSRAFASQNQMLVNSANQYVAAKSAMADAKTNPAATKSAILNFAATVDSRAQLRQGTINFIQKIDPSWKGSVSAWFSNAFSGKLPPDQLAKMEQVIDHMHYQQAKMYEERYQGVIKRVPSASSYLTPTTELFGDVINSYQPPTSGDPVTKANAAADAYWESRKKTP